MTVKRRVRDFWQQHPLFTGESRLAPGSHDFFSAHWRLRTSELSGSLDQIFFREVEGADVLDAGCGIGFWVLPLHRRGAAVMACDLTESACHFTRQRAALANVTVPVTVGDAEALPYAHGSFEHVNCQGVIHHTPEASRCVREFHRVLKPGGTLCLSVYFRTLPLRSRWLYRLTAAIAGKFMVLRGRGRETMFEASSPDDFVRQYDGAHNPLGRAYSRAELRRLVGTHFEILEEVRIGFPRRVLPFGLPNGIHRILSRILGLMIVIRCRRLDAPVEAQV